MASPLLVPLWFVGICTLLCFMLDSLRVGVVDDAEMCLVSFGGLLLLVPSMSGVVCLLLFKLVPKCVDVLGPF